MMEWPGLVRPLVERYGPERVWTVGLTVLGFPPTWVGGFVNIRRLEAALSEEPTL